MKIDGSLGLSPMNIRCEFEDQLKTLLCGVHTVKNTVSCLVAANVTYGWRQFTVVQTMAQ